MKSIPAELLVAAPNLEVVLRGGAYTASQIALEALKAQLRCEGLLTQQNALLERIALGIEHQNGIGAEAGRRTRRKAG